MGSGSSHNNGYGRNNYPFHGNASQTQASGYSQGSSYGSYGATNSSGMYRGNVQSPAGLQFKSSPFYVVQSRIGEVRTCEGKHAPAPVFYAA